MPCACAGSALGYDPGSMSTAPPMRSIDREVARIRAAQDVVAPDSVTDLAAEVMRRSSLAVTSPSVVEAASVIDELPAHRVPADLAQILDPIFGLALPRTPRSGSSSAEGTIGSEVEPVVYYEYQHETWRRLLALQAELVRDRCCKEYSAGRRLIAQFENHIPSIPELDAWLETQTGWRLVRADGYVTPAKFFEFLANGHFPCMDQLRHEKELLYSPAPDMYHDIVGHLPMLCQPRFSEYYRTFGRAGVRARHLEQAQALDRIYWFTMEFGLVATESEPLAYGAALLTGLSELITSRGVHVERESFTIDAAIRTHTDVMRPNEKLYVTRDFDTLVTEFVAWARDERLL